MERAEKAEKAEKTVRTKRAERTERTGRTERVGKAERVETVIIGGGLSGLACALSLFDKGVSDFLVLEARKRVGGRTCTEKAENGSVVDVGGAYVGPGQVYVMELVARFGLELYKIPHDGDSVVIDDGKRFVYKGEIPSYPFHVLLDLNDLLCRLDDLTTEMKNTHANARTDFMKNPRFVELDKVSVSQWVESRAWTRQAKDAVKGAAFSLTCCHPDEVSMLWFANMCRSGENLHRLITVENGAQERKVVQGTMAISESIAALIGRDRVRMECVVREIRYESGDDVVVTLEEGPNRTIKLIQCKRVVVCMSPPLWSSIQWTPPLPSSKQQAAQGMQMGSVLKTHVFYKNAHWRERGLSGECLTSNGYPVVYCVDDSKDGHACLMGFVSATSARKLQQLSCDERLQILHDHYRFAFQLSDDETPIGYHEKNWTSEEFSKGCYCAVCPPGLMTSTQSTSSTTTWASILSDPLDNKVYFAGSEMSTHWIGYMDGAIESGYEVAAMLLGVAFDVNERPMGDLIKWKPCGLTFWERHAPSLVSFVSFVVVVGSVVLWWLFGK